VEKEKSNGRWDGLERRQYQSGGNSSRLESGPGLLEIRALTTTNGGGTNTLVVGLRFSF
jgi:hypothetical protein